MALSYNDGMETHIVNTQTGATRERKAGEEPGENEIGVPSWLARTPTRGLNLYHKRSRRTAIEAFCIMCMGNNIAMVKRCESHWCPLWPFRYGAEKKVLPPTAPPANVLKLMAKARRSDPPSDNGKRARVRL